jgi:hypothetical protein
MRRRTVVLLSLSGVLGALLVAAVLIRTFGMDARGYRAASESMVPTLQLGDRITANLGAPGGGRAAAFVALSAQGRMVDDDVTDLRRRVLGRAGRPDLDAGRRRAA